MDDMRSMEARCEFEIRMRSSNVDISRIQETHNTISAGEKCTITDISTAARQITKQPDEKAYGGIEIMIKNARGGNILQTTRYSHRCIEITLQTGVGNKNLHIINTYAPHMGYSREERGKYWKLIKKS